jgi:Raf kinase inhibitor-like YbhB/YbcL family protein
MGIDTVPGRTKAEFFFERVSGGLLVGVLMVFFGVAGCKHASNLAEGKPVLALSSTGITNGAVGRRFTCEDADISPELAWSAPPTGTQSFAVIVSDRDALLGSFVHWVLYNVPADRRELPEGLPKQTQLADGSIQVQNDFEKTGYGGPCPPGGAPHHYVFKVYAVDSKLNLPEGATRKQVEAALQGHVLAGGELTGQYAR